MARPKKRGDDPRIDRFFALAESRTDVGDAYGVAQRLRKQAKARPGARRRTLVRAR